MAIYDTSISTSERMCGSVGEELQNGPKEGYWRANVGTLLVVYVPVGSGEPR